MLLKLFIVFMICLMASGLQSCAQISVAQVDVKRMTYKALRQHDCRINEPDKFCSRGFSNEYAQYKRLRQQFLNDKLNDKEDSAEKYHQTSLDRRILEIW